MVVRCRCCERVHTDVGWTHLDPSLHVAERLGWCPACLGEVVADLSAVIAVRTAAQRHAPTLLANLVQGR